MPNFPETAIGSPPNIALEVGMYDPKHIKEEMVLRAMERKLEKDRRTADADAIGALTVKVEKLTGERDQLQRVVEIQAGSFAKLEAELADARKERTCGNMARKRGEFTCSACRDTWAKPDVDKFKYCPSCGARVVDSPPTI